jgi:hypothetical protein
MAMVGYPFLGFWSRTHQFNDANGDGIIVPSEITMSDTGFYVGPSSPTRTLSVMPRVEFLARRLAITALVDHQGGLKKFDALSNSQCFRRSCRAMYDPSASLSDQAATVASLAFNVADGMIFDGSFTRLRDVSVSYRLPTRLVSRVRANDLTIVASGRNLAVWTRYPGTDPEMAFDASDANGNVEYFSMPPLRSFSLRLNVTF